jgi:hypothetical protein
MTSRARRPIEPITRPSAVHDAVETTTQSASAGIDERGGSKSSSAQPTRKPNVETITPLTKFGSVRPMNSAKRLAGVARSGDSVCVQRSPPIVIAIP